MTNQHATCTYYLLHATPLQLPAVHSKTLERLPMRRSLCRALCYPLAMHSAHASAQNASPASAPDLILTNGKIFTADSAQPWAQALAIHGARIAAVGTNEEIAALARAHTRRIDLAG